MAAWCRRLIAAVVGTIVSTTVPIFVDADRSASAAPAREALAALTADQRAFLAMVATAARTSQRRYGIPASVVIAQAVQETGWGTSELARTARNHFGMTCGSVGRGPVAIGCRTGPERFCDRSGCRRESASFRVYRATADSFRDHGRQLSTHPRYRHAIAANSHPETFVKRMAQAGYATDPHYAERLILIMRKYRLYRYDKR
jgi:flagellar protein FlgJ